MGKLQMMVSESKAELWDSITYFATTNQIYQVVLQYAIFERII
jgi:hypothetical protein